MILHPGQSHRVICFPTESDDVLGGTAPDDNPAFAVINAQREQVSRKSVGVEAQPLARE
jgi:hypothetical protein